VSPARALEPYRAVFGSRAREELQYRAAAFAGLVTQVVFGFILLMVLFAFYDSSGAPRPLSDVETAAYVWMGQALLALLPWNVEPAAFDSIRTGTVVQELLRPVHLYRMWFARALAWRLVRSALRFIPMVIMAMVVFRLIGWERYAMPMPASATALAVVLLAVALGALLSTAITLLMQIAMLWTTTPEGIVRLVPTFFIVLGGTLLPLPLFPERLQGFMRVQPLRGLVDTPARAYTADLVGMEALGALAWSAAWLILLVILGHVALRRGTRRLVVAGG
jgi:ABC-2 type transport system permease protein